MSVNNEFPDDTVDIFILSMYFKKIHDIYKPSLWEMK